MKITNGAAAQIKEYAKRAMHVPKESTEDYNLGLSDGLTLLAQLLAEQLIDEDKIDA